MQNQWMKVNLRSDTSKQIDQYLTIEQPETLKSASEGPDDEKFDYDLFNNL